jgi:hypothetical protein
VRCTNDHEEFEIYHGLSESMITASTFRSGGKQSEAGILVTPAEMYLKSISHTVE